MRIVAFLASAFAVAALAHWYFLQDGEVNGEEVVKTPTLITVSIAGTETAMGIIDYDWKRRGPDAVANFSIENTNEFDVTSFEIVCFLFDKDANKAGEVRHAVSSKLAANSKIAVSGVLFRNVNPLSRTAICNVGDARPKVRF